MRVPVLRFVLAASVIAPGIAFAETPAGDPLRTIVPAGGGLDAMAVRIDRAKNVLEARRCKTNDCSDASTAAAKEIPLAIDRSRLDVAHTRFEIVPIGEGRQLVHVKVPDMQRKDLAFEALVAGSAEPFVFSGLTGYTRGDEGDRAGEVLLFYDRDDKSRFVIVAEAREDTRICGQAVTPLSAKGLDVRSMQLRGATLHRLEKKARDAAAKVVATGRPAEARAPLARVLVATGGSSPGAPALTDGNADTMWTENRPGDGHGEFVTLRAPSEVPITALTIAIAPKQPKAEGAAPRTLFIATDAKLFHVTMPEDAWLKPGQSYEVPLPEPVKTTCVAVVLDEAYARGKNAPEVGIAEVAAITKFDSDKATLDDVAKELAGPRAEEAAAVLRRSGPDGLTAVAKRWDTLDPKGRAFAIDVASSAGTCDGPTVDLLTRGLVDKDVEVKKRALGRIERCGKNAADALASVVKTSDEPRRAATAPLLAAVAPSIALEPLGELLGQGTPETRRAVRGAFARAATSAPRDKLLVLVQKKDAPLPARLDLLRGMAPRLHELRPESDAALAEILRSSPDMPTRYLVMQPLAALAAAPDATSGELTRLSEMAKRDPEWPVRARAVELAATIGPLAPTIVGAAADPEPRVREAALKSIAVGKLHAGVPNATRALENDPWTFVRVAAAEALTVMPEVSGTSAALANALEDASPRVRLAVLEGLGKQRAQAHAKKVLARLDDAKEDVDVRAAAARTLGAMCEKSVLDRLTKLADRARAPIGEADDRIGMAAIDALGAIHPTDLDKRLGPLRGKDVRLPVRRAADRALAEPGTCTSR